MWWDIDVALFSPSDSQLNAFTAAANKPDSEKDDSFNQMSNMQVMAISPGVWRLIKYNSMTKAIEDIIEGFSGAPGEGWDYMKFIN